MRVYGNLKIKCEVLEKYKTLHIKKKWQKLTQSTGFTTLISYTSSIINPS